jgi:hypothetical protein
LKKRVQKVEKYKDGQSVQAERKEKIKVKRLRNLNLNHKTMLH